jgi:hypothetical protein
LTVSADGGLADGDEGDAEGTYLNRDASAVLFNSLAAVHIAAAERMRQVRFLPFPLFFVV